MKTYLEFSNKGEIKEHKINNRFFNKENYTDFKYIDKIIYNKYNFILLYNALSESNSLKNITHLPFYNNDIYGNFLLLRVTYENGKEKENNKEIDKETEDNIKLNTFNEIKFLKLINITDKPIEDYSSDDFNLSD